MSQSQGDSQSTVISIRDLSDFKIYFVNSDGERILLHFQFDFRPDINCGGHVDNDFIFEFALGILCDPSSASETCFLVYSNHPEFPASKTCI
jgi:hypothetical protein